MYMYIKLGDEDCEFQPCLVEKESKDCISNKLAVHFDMLGVFIGKDKILNNVQCCLTVTIKLYGLQVRNVKTTQYL